MLRIRNDSRQVDIQMSETMPGVFHIVTRNGKKFEETTVNKEGCFNLFLDTITENLKLSDFWNGQRRLF